MINPSAAFANKLLENACEKRASDIHFYPLPNKDKINIYYRLLGKRTFIRSINKSMYQLLLTYFKFTSRMDIGEVRKPQNGTLHFENSKKETFSLRLSTLPLVNLESLTIRILPQEITTSLDQLFLFPNQFKKMRNWLKLQSGIILITGPTGCGKSTTMYALLESMLEDRTFQAITLEDPIERQLNDVLQVEVNEKAGVTYHTGLKAALRHDPDVLMIGEIRDQETAEFAFRAALTGHLVLSTIHAKNAQGTIDRLIDLGINRNQMSQTLIAVSAIQLLPIKYLGNQSRRAAIVELLDGQILQRMIKGDDFTIMNHYHSFQHLREKAYLYGFISEEVYNETNF